MKWFQRFLFPDPPRKLPRTRAWNIAFRTAHIGVTGILFGGHVFGISAEHLHLWLHLTILTGICLMFIEAYPSCQWFYQGRGVMMLSKLALLCLMPVFWQYRVHLLVIVLVIASVGSHMPGRFRYYSLVHRRVMND